MDEEGRAGKSTSVERDGARRARSSRPRARPGEVGQAERGARAAARAGAPSQSAGRRRSSGPGGPGRARAGARSRPAFVWGSGCVSGRAGGVDDRQPGRARQGKARHDERTHLVAAVADVDVAVGAVALLGLHLLVDEPEGAARAGGGWVGSGRNGATRVQRVCAVWPEKQEEQARTGCGRGCSRGR